MIGVVENAKYDSSREASPPTVYYQFGVSTDRLFSMIFVLHAQTAAAARSAYHRALQELASDSPEGERLLSVLSGFFAALTLLLSGIGVYGLMASDVTSRRTEIGVRMALGATRGGIFLLFLRKAAALLAAGVLAGSPLAYFLACLLKAFLYGVTPRSPALFAAAISLLALAGLLAALLPALRAVSTEPAAVLRSE